MRKEYQRIAKAFEEAAMKAYRLKEDKVAFILTRQAELYQKMAENEKDTGMGLQ